MYRDEHGLTGGRRAVALAAELLLVGAVAGSLVGCAAASGSPAASDSPAAAADVTVAVFGDSWGYGAHCGGCTPWPKLLDAGYESELGISVDVVDLVENGGTPIRSSQSSARMRTSAMRSPMPTS